MSGSADSTIVGGAGDLSAPRTAATQIGPYRLLEQIGEGGFGIVYRAEQREPFRREVALKLIKPGMDSRPIVARFEAERQALAFMDHPGVAKVLDGGATADGRPYFVMEFVRGEPIAAFCDKNRLSIDERLKLFIAVCEAVQHAHTKGVVHRDLKPSNILVSYDAEGRPQPKVIDFGVAKALHQPLTEHTLFTERGQIIGTPEYMSPEQADTREGDIDTRSDIYSLGVVLYELLTGVRPFESETLRRAGLAEIVRIIREVEPPKPSTRLAALATRSPSPSPSPLKAEGDQGGSLKGRGEGDSSAVQVAARRRSDPRSLSVLLRRDLDWVVMRCLEKDRARRYETANGLAMELRRYLASEPLLAGPPSAAYRVRKFVVKNRAAVAAALVFVLALSSLTGWAMVERARADSQRRTADVERDRANAERLRAEAALADATKSRDETKQVSDFQSQMLSQIDTTQAGVDLMKDIRERLATALEQAGVPEAERRQRLDALAAELVRVNATDAAAALIDRTILRPAIRTIGERFKDQPAVDAQLRQALAALYRTIGLHDAAYPLQESALETRRRVLGEEHPDTLASIGNMGALLKEQGKLAEAEPYTREALETKRRVLGEEHPGTLTSISIMGTLLQDQGKLAEAEPYLREALEKRRRALGEEHPDTLSSINNLGALLQAQDKPAEAEPYYREALEKFRRVLGEEHPDTLISISNMGALYKAQGKLAEAEPYTREAMDKRRRVLGEEHPDTLTSISNLGALLQAQGKLSEAAPYYREALEKKRRVLGEEHPDTLVSINNMGFLLQAQGKLAEAEPYVREALETKRRVLGEEHADTLLSINNLGALLYAQGKLAEAEPYFREALEKFRRLLGEEHPNTLVFISNMGALLKAQGKLAEAAPYYREALEKRRRTLGEEHPDTLNSINNMGMLLQAQGKLAEAEPYIRDALEKSRRVLGEEHPDTLNSINNMGYLLQAQGKLAEAEPFYREALEEQRRLLGEEHPSALNSNNNMGGLLRALGRPKEAIALLEPVETAVRRVFAGGNDLSLGRFLTHLGRSRVATAEFERAEANLIEAHAIVMKAPDATAQHRAEVLTGLVELYEAWSAASAEAEDDQTRSGRAAKAAEWRAKLEERQASTQPAATRSAATRPAGAVPRD